MQSSESIPVRTAVQQYTRSVWQSYNVQSIPHGICVELPHLHLVPNCILVHWYHTGTSTRTATSKCQYGLGARTAIARVSSQPALSCPYMLVYRTGKILEKHVGKQQMLENRGSGRAKPLRPPRTSRDEAKKLPPPRQTIYTSTAHRSSDKNVYVPSII